MFSKEEVFVLLAMAKLCDAQHLDLFWFVMQKVTGGFGFNFQGRFDLAQRKNI